MYNDRNLGKVLAALQEAGLATRASAVYVTGAHQARLATSHLSAVFKGDAEGGGDVRKRRFEYWGHWSKKLPI